MKKLESIVDRESKRIVEKVKKESKSKLRGNDAIDKRRLICEKALSELIGRNKNSINTKQGGVLQSRERMIKIPFIDRAGFI